MDEPKPAVEVPKEKLPWINPNLTVKDATVGIAALVGVVVGLVVVIALAALFAWSFIQTAIDTPHARIFVGILIWLFVIGAVAKAIKRI